ncbi:VWA domain-containing protein [bacterium]|jgi:Ca-activated chloride channel homolog|nr:VWA domain-containing protein [bacterium]MBT3581995.1 VWA domain-containing protein [bacterium]MBT4552377.1 VWA domain-containing protein [bacterium]MBT7087688.1 VWA domain-containing protein [bacterium]
MSLANPILLILFLLIVGVWVLKRKGRDTKLTLKYPDTGSLKTLEDKPRKILMKAMVVLRYLILILIVLALARPQVINWKNTVSTQGVDILLALDVSLSMNAEDFKPQNRLAVAKNTMRKFIEKRKNDRIGLVVFGGEAYTQSPLTLDHNILFSQITTLETGMLGDGTAIGSAIATALNRIKTSEAKSKIIILLTDGVNNRGEITPLSAADLAQKLGIKIYTIGVGKKGGAPVPIIDPVYGKVYARNADGSLQITQIDENLLKEIAQKTNGLYFRALDEKGLTKIYQQIDQLEKSKIKTKLHVQYKDFFMTILWWVFGLLCLEIFFNSFILRSMP